MLTHVAAPVKQAHYESLPPIHPVQKDDEKVVEKSV